MNKSSNHGKVTLKFDNSYSRWYGKEVAVKYGVINKAGEEATA